MRRTIKMKYSKADEFCTSYDVISSSCYSWEHVGVRQLAENQKVFTTYLSKILTKLVKAGMVESKIVDIAKQMTVAP